MKILYKRLMNKKGHFVGFQRTVVEFLPAGLCKWQLEPIEYSDELSSKIEVPPSNIVSMKRPNIE